MGTELVGAFRWQFSTAGYGWQDGRPCTERDGPALRLLVEQTAAGGPHDLREYAPLSPSNAALFRTFADTEPTEDGVLAFANRYGPLTRGVPVELGKPGKVPAWQGVYGEPWPLWRSHLSLMHHMTALWDMVEKDDHEALARHVRWEKDERGQPLVSYDSHPHLHPAAHSREGHARRHEAIASTQVYQQEFGTFTEGDVMMPAVVYLRRVVESMLEGQGRLVMTAAEQRPRKTVMRVGLKSLVGCLWFQFADAINCDKRQRQCDQCRRWFSIPQLGSRVDKRYCGTPCRLKAYRQRQEQARRLKAAGKTVGQIANELGSDPDIVKGWLKGTREK
jgi:hypothetical protein